MTSTDGVTALSAGLPRNEVREIKGGSHMLLLEYPEEVAQAIKQFIAELPDSLTAWIECCES